MQTKEARVPGHAGCPSSRLGRRNSDSGGVPVAVRIRPPPWLFALTVAALPCGCGESIVTTTPTVQGQPIEGSLCAEPPAYNEDLSSCSPASTDYMPRSDNSADDAWDACISDDGNYVQIEQSVSSVARVEAYGRLAELLWDNSSPTSVDFLDARSIFEEREGLGSRVARRYDVHWEPPVDGKCTDAGVADANPQYCVGPAKLQPIINDAFETGGEGLNRVVSAARLQAALQWFLYVSSVKEATTCTGTQKDCDSAWAYYSGGTVRDQPRGLAADIDALSPETHDRAFDGVLAVRCWRDLDQEVPAADLQMRDLAINQLDTAVTRGVAMLVRQRFAALACSTGEYKAAQYEALRVLVPLLDRATRQNDASLADGLLAAVESATADSVDVSAAIDALDQAFPCP